MTYFGYSLPLSRTATCPGVYLRGYHCLPFHIETDQIADRFYKNNQLHFWAFFLQFLGEDDAF